MTHTLMPVTPLPADELLIRPWPPSQHGLLVKHLPTGLITIRADGSIAKSRAACLRDLALLVAHHQRTPEPTP